jgi:cystathionine gamma-lyase
LIASLELPEAASQIQDFSSEERTRPENLPSALAFASGSAALQAVISSLVKANGHVIAVNDVYGGTYRYLTKVAVNSGITTTFVEMSAPETVEDLEAHRDTVAARIEAAFTPETQLVWIETPTNPTLRLVDIRLVVEIAHRHGALVAVDNTFLSPYYQRPLELGADIVSHSATKYLNGFSEWVQPCHLVPGRS